MHLPDSFKESDPHLLHSLIDTHPLGTWVTFVNDEINVNHIPFVLDKEVGEYGVLRGHINRGNPVCKSLTTGKQSTVIFHGAESYISPSWYASKKIHEKVVPTWNYAVVHAHGVAKIIDDKQWLLEQLNTLTDSQEKRLQQGSIRTIEQPNDESQSQAKQWKVADAPKSYIERMMNGIIGIEIPIDKLTGTWKTSQNKQTQDKASVIAGLSALTDSNSAEMASYIAKHTD